MFPLKAEQPYPRQQWWVAAYGSEISRAITGRTILGERIVMYRTESGEVAALAGYCPHRSFPFEQSMLVGDAIQCGYHGFTFDKGGACVKVPSQTNVPTNTSVRRYPAVERGGLVWVWTGVEQNADLNLIPDTDAIGLGAGSRIDASPMVTIKGRYTLLIDNLIDLTHASFIHADTVPGAGAIVLTESAVQEDARSLCVERVGKNLPLNPYASLLFPGYEGELDQHFDAEYFGPCLIRTGGDMKSSQNGRMLGTLNFIHAITPETPGSVHYWVMTTRDFQLDNDILSRANLDMGDKIQPQDILAIELIEQALQSYAADPKEISCRADTGALKVRHRLDLQIQQEAKRATPSPVERQLNAAA